MFLVDVGHPLRRNHSETANRVDAHLRHQAEFVIEDLPDLLVGLAEQVVRVVLATRRIAPYDALDVVVLAVDEQLPAILVLVRLNDIGGYRLVCKWHAQDQRHCQQAGDSGQTREEAHSRHSEHSFFKFDFLRIVE